MPRGPRLVLTASERAFAAWMLLRRISSGLEFLDFMSPPEPADFGPAAAIAILSFSGKKGKTLDLKEQLLHTDRKTGVKRKNRD
jgi:hypothetical protein